MKQQKWKSKSFALLLAIMMIFTMMPQMAFADGTAAAPQEAGSASSAQHVIVSTADELAQWGGVDCTGTIELADNIDMSDKTMKPIKSLNGTFEGNGYTISNLTLSGSTQDQAFGLIAQLEGSIRNLQLVDVQVKPEATKTVYGGALAGSISGTGEIYRCSVIDSTIVGSKTARIDLTLAGANSTTGGLIGEVASGANVTIQDCLNTTGVKSAINAGGLIGNALFAAEITIRNSVVLGDVELTNKNGGGIIGMLGNVPVTANQVYFGGIITGNSDKYGFAYNNAYRLTNKISI